MSARTDLEFKELDAIAQEIAFNESEAMIKITAVLEDENKILKSVRIEKIISILKLWGSIPASELKHKAEVI